MPNEVTVTLKSDGGPWVVVHAEDLETLDGFLDGLDALMPKIVEKAVSFKGAGASLTGARGASSAAVAPAVAPAAAVPAGQVKLKIPFGVDAKDVAKSLGARWDKDAKLWIGDAALAQHPALASYVVQ